MTNRLYCSRLPAAVMLAALVLLAIDDVAAQDDSRPLVEGGITDKPFITGASRVGIGGYTEAHWRWEQVDGFTDELGFEMKRFNLFAYSPVSERVRVAGELEFEEGGEEIKVEAALVDFEISPALTFRGGIILSPLGRFNLAHDSPANDLTDRPLVSTQIIGVALSEAGMGFYGAFYPTEEARVTYEVYGVNGFHDGVIGGDGKGVRIPAGRGNWEDNNTRPSWTGRVAVSPRPTWEIGASLHTGPYNVYDVEGLEVDDKRNVTIVALDGDWSWRNFELLGEYATATVDVPASNPLLIENQAGFYAQTNAHFGRGWFPGLPNSVFSGIVRYGIVDFDADADGDDLRRWTLGINFRPEEDTVFKLDWQRSIERDSFESKVKFGALLFSVATYF
ncbi:MAG: hypothetical protein VX733_08300 [Candidatus Latescibacterota bacterium]|nr:hypothetical protein [Candidatus Latescibacterota bacterium]